MSWAQVAADDDFNRHHVSGGFFNSSADCAAEVDEISADLRAGSSTGEGVVGCSESASYAASYGYRFTERWGIEAGYIIGPEVELAVVWDDDPNDPNAFVYAFGAAADITTLYAAGTVRFGGSGWVQGYALAGLASWSADYGALVAAANNTVDLGGLVLDSDSGTGLIYGLGALFDIGKGFGIRLGYKAVTDAEVSYLGTELVWSF